MGPRAVSIALGIRPALVATGDLLRGPLRFGNVLDDVRLYVLGTRERVRTTDFPSFNWVVAFKGNSNSSMVVMVTDGQ